MVKWMCAAILLTATAAFAEESKAAGSWKIDGDVQGHPIIETCKLSGPDDKLTGSCVGEKTADATATFDGKTLTLKHPGEYQGQALTVTFAGKMQDVGTLSGTIDVEPLGYDGTFTAKRSETKAATAAQ